MNTKQQLRMLILGVLERQPEHGYAIAQAIKGRSEGLLSAKEGTLYPALHTLEAEHLLESSEVEVGGRIEARVPPDRQGPPGVEAGAG